MEYKVYWTDMHSNLHHEEIDKLPQWIEQMKKTMDFWPFAYYPYYMKKDVSGLPVEDMYPLDEINKDWEYVRELTKKTNDEGFPMFMGYEWQGAGLDGDHNVFFKDNDENMSYPYRYEQLKELNVGKNTIAIPHHLAYQLGHRGKNWDTHDDKFSPFAEVYSSHGSSENDYGSISMDRHIHMGPRTGVTSVEEGWNKGNMFGVIAAGDNHSCPGVYGFGSCAVLARSNSKEDIWDAMINRRVYGVSKDRIELDLLIDNQTMGGVIKPCKNSHLTLNIKGSNAIDRIEIIQDNIVTEMIPHTSTWERNVVDGIVRFKFHLELGWGPDRRIFTDISSKQWAGNIQTSGKILSVDKCWSNFGQELTKIDDSTYEFSIKTFKTTASGKWMGPSAVTTEGFIFEIEADIDSDVQFNINGVTYTYSVQEILANSCVIPLMDEVKELLKERYQFDSYYRSDSWWHNAYKIKINKGVPSIGYECELSRELDLSECKQIRVRVWQKNGSLAWSSPIFISEVSNV